jgi:hypothetical protein
MQVNYLVGISGILPRADKSAPTDVPIILLMCIIGSLRPWDARGILPVIKLYIIIEREQGRGQVLHLDLYLKDAGRQTGRRLESERSK